MSRNKDWFTYTATALHSAEPGRDKTWRVDAITWSEQNTEAIAGLHNKGRRAFALLDEASAIPDPVWETIEGALTDADTELIWAGVRQSDAHHRPLPRMLRRRPLRPSLEPAPDRFALGRHDQQGADRRLGEGLRRGLAISSASACAASSRAPARCSSSTASASPRPSPARWRRTRRRRWSWASTSPARATTSSVIRFRRGLDARSIPAVKFRIPDLMQIASRVMEQVNAHNPDAVFVDGTGIGWGVIDRLSQLGCPNRRGVDFGGQADRTDASDAAARYANKRAEMWGFMKDWCKVGCLPDDRELAADLGNVEYGYDAVRRHPARAQGRHAEARASPRPTTATRWRSPSPIRWPRRTGRRSGASRKGSRN